MRVLQVNKFMYRKGGSEEYMFRLTDLLRENGVDCAFWGMADEKNIVVDDFNCFARKVDYASLKGLNRIAAGVNTIYSRDNAKRIGIILNAFKPEIVHLHNYN